MTQVGTLIAPLYMRRFFNLIAQSTPSEEIAAQLVLILFVVVGWWLLEWAGRRTQEFGLGRLESRAMADLLNSSFSYLLGHSHNFFTSRFAGSLTHRLTKFARAYEAIIDAVIFHFLSTFILVVGAIVILSFRNITLGVALFVWSVCFLAFQFYVSRLRQPLRNVRAAADTKVTANLADAISNQSTIVLFSGAKHEEKRFATTVGTWTRATLRSWNADHLIWACIGLFMMVIEAGLLYGAVHFWKQGLLTIGDFVLIQAYLLSVFSRLVDLNRELRRFYDAIADAEETQDILDTLHDVSDTKSAKSLVVSDGAIEFKNVDFHFHKETAVFSDFNLAISGREKVALIGPSGAGKSTVTKLLLRLFDVKDGTILIDGQDIAKVTQESLRDAIAFVPQEPILFHRTLMENIRYGRRDATDEEVIEAAKKAHCHEFIERLPLKYETFVGERGVKLSGGERQRVAIARAILKDAPILMLDEATSSLDSESEVLIQDALATLMKGKTVIVIAHRLSTIMKMDRIIAIEAGRIAEEGTHHELTAKNGLYARLWSHQAGGFIQD